MDSVEKITTIFAGLVIILFFIGKFFFDLQETQLVLTIVIAAAAVLFGANRVKKRVQ